MKTTQRTEYLDILGKLAHAGRPEPLKRVIAARVCGSYEEVPVELGDGEPRVVSPPLERDEPDRNALLYTAFSILRQEPDPRGLENLRRAVMELFVAALQGGRELTVVRDLARLVGHLRLVDSEELRPQLLHQLYGYLEAGLPGPFEEVLHLDGEALEKAIIAFDAWLAVLPILPVVSNHLATRIEVVLEAAWGIVNRGRLKLEPRFPFLILAFRALLKLQPAAAASRWVWLICRLVDRHSGLIPDLERRWLAACQHQGVVFDANPEWRSAFIKGFAGMKDRDLILAMPAAALFGECLDLLGVRAEVEILVTPRPAKPQLVLVKVA